VVAKGTKACEQVLAPPGMAGSLRSAEPTSS
jgi:hypothetical protein